MNPISITVTGTLGADPREFTVRDDTPGVELRLALELPPRTPGGREVTRWVKVVAFGNLATHTAASVRKGERVTVTADDVRADAWSDRNSGEARGQVVLLATDIAASLRFDTLTTGYADRKAARAAAAKGEPNELPAGEQADLKVLDGVTS